MQCTFYVFSCAPSCPTTRLCKKCGLTLDVFQLPLVSPDQEAKEKQHRARERSLLEQLGDAESDFSRVQAALEKEKNTALRKLRSEIGRLHLWHCVSKLC